MAQRGWNVVVSNHRGLGGVSITVSIDIETYESLILLQLLKLFFFLFEWEMQSSMGCHIYD